MEAIGSGIGSPAEASVASSGRSAGLAGHVSVDSAVMSEAEGASADNDADDSVEEAGMTEEDDEEDDDDAERKARADSVSSTGTSRAKAGGAKHRSPGKMKRKSRLGESEEDPQESTADEEDDEEDDEVADDEEDEDDEEDDKASAMDEEEEEDDAEDAGRIDVSDSASMLRMMRSLSEEEARRHEQFRRSHFERGAVKRCMAQAIQESLGGDRKVPSVTNVMAIVMAGMTKVFVGEITAEARRIMEKNGETGPILPRHLREAHRRYYRRRPLARGRNLRRLFR